MRIQKLILEIDAGEFHEKVNESLEKGWRIVENTLTHRMSCTRDSVYHSYMALMENFVDSPPTKN